MQQLEQNCSRWFSLFLFFSFFGHISLTVALSVATSVSSSFPLLLTVWKHLATQHRQSHCCRPRDCESSRTLAVFVPSVKQERRDLFHCSTPLTRRRFGAFPKSGGFSSTLWGNDPQTNHQHQTIRNKSRKASVHIEQILSCTFKWTTHFFLSSSGANEKHLKASQ